MPEVVLLQYDVMHVTDMPQASGTCLETLKHTDDIPQVVLDRYHLRQTTDMPQAILVRYHLRHTADLPQVVLDRYH